MDNFFTNEQKQNVLDMIDIDIPSIEDMDSLEEAFIIEEEKINSINQNRGSLNRTHNVITNDYQFEQSTDLSALTGRNRIFDMYYLSDPVEGDNQCIMRYTNGTIIREYDDDQFLRKFIIRPVLRFNRCPKLFDTLITTRGIDKNSKYARISLGYMPQYAVQNNSEKRDELLKNKKQTKTNDVYTFDSVNANSEHSEKIGFKPIDYPVYQDEEGKKYIIFKVFQNAD